jgi:type IV fimbrial biogenesis protein FimT
MNPSTQRRVRLVRGYTLLELLIATTVLLILLSLALPSFSSVMRRTQGDALMYSLINHAQLARSTAISRRQPVVFCASADTQTCSGDWNKGAIVFADANNNRQVDDDETVLSTLPPTPQGSRLIMRAALNKQYLRFMSNGMLENTAGSWIFCPANSTAHEARNLIFSRNGRLRFGYDRNRDCILENAEGQPISCPS